MARPKSKKQKEATSGSKDLVKFVRECVNPKGSKGLFLKELNDAQLAEVYGRLKLGQSYRLIADVIQKDWGVFTDKDRHNVETAIHKLKHRALGKLETESKAEASRLIPKEEREGYKKHRENVLKELQERGKAVDALELLRFSLHRQAERVRMWEDLEKKVPMKQATSDIRLLGELAERAVKLEIELGVRERQPNEIVVTQNHKFEALIQGLNDDGDALIHAAGRLLESTESEVLTLEVGTDGTYKTRPRTGGEQTSDLAFGICGGITVNPDKVARAEKERIEDPGITDHVLSSLGD